ARGRPTNPARDTKRSKCRKSQHFGRLASDGDNQVDAIFLQNASDETNVILLHGADIVAGQIFVGPNDIVSRNIPAGRMRIPHPTTLGPFPWARAAESHMHNKIYDFVRHLEAGAERGLRGRAAHGGGGGAGARGIAVAQGTRI
ncbi:MAG TPA: hypothetical protein VJK90_13035, partial [Acetobacteraceae bacterium]|nr:hypothetical protein [Acetobacteraceae bacterium]